MRLKPLVIVVGLMQVLLVVFQAHALTTGKVDILPDVIRNLKEFLVDMRTFAAIDTSYLLKKQQLHSDLPPEIQAEIAELSYGYQARALDGVKGKFKQMSVLFQNPFARPDAQDRSTATVLNAAGPASSALPQSIIPSLSVLREARKQAQGVITLHLQHRVPAAEYDVAFNKESTPKQTANKNPLR